MDNSQSVECQLIKFLFIFPPNSFPAIILPITPTVKYNFIKFIIKWLFFASPCCVLEFKLFPFGFLKCVSILIRRNKRTIGFFSCSYFFHHLLYFDNWQFSLL